MSTFNMAEAVGVSSEEMQEMVDSLQKIKEDNSSMSEVAKIFGEGYDPTSFVAGIVLMTYVALNERRLLKGLC